MLFEMNITSNKSQINEKENTEVIANKINSNLKSVGGTITDLAIENSLHTFRTLMKTQAEFYVNFAELNKSSVAMMKTMFDLGPTSKLFEEENFINNESYTFEYPEMKSMNKQMIKVKKPEFQSDNEILEDNNYHFEYKNLKYR